MKLFNFKRKSEQELIVEGLRKELVTELKDIQKMEKKFGNEPSCDNLILKRMEDTYEKSLTLQKEVEYMNELRCPQTAKEIRIEENSTKIEDALKAFQSGGLLEEFKKGNEAVGPLLHIFTNDDD